MMKIDDYQRLAARTMNIELDSTQHELHALYGMCSEVGEIQGLYQKLFQGHRIETEHLKKELGDLMWFIAEYCTANGWNLSEICEMNIEKLRKRYPDGFEAEKSLNREEGDV